MKTTRTEGKGSAGGCAVVTTMCAVWHAALLASATRGPRLGSRSCGLGSPLILHDAHWWDFGQELRMNGTGDYRAGERQANENAAEDRSCEEEAHGPHDGTPVSTRTHFTPRQPRGRAAGSSATSRLWIHC